MDLTTEESPFQIRAGRVRARFGIVADPGYQPVPDLLLFKQAELGLGSVDLNVLLNLLAHWYEPDRMPFPRVSTIARRMGVSERSVQRTISRLSARRFIRKSKEGGRTYFDLTPLIDKLRPFAKDWLDLRVNAPARDFKDML